TLANAFPGTSIQGRPGSSQGRLINWRDPYQDNFNLTLEQQVFKDSSMEIGYVGARGTGQKMSVDFNGPIFGTGTAQLRRPHPERGASGNGAVPWGHRWYDSMQAKWQTRKSNLSLLASYTYSKLLTVGGGGINEFSQDARFS